MTRERIAMEKIDLSAALSVDVVVTVRVHTDSQLFKTLTESAGKFVEIIGYSGKYRTAGYHTFPDDRMIGEFDLEKLPDFPEVLI